MICLFLRVFFYMYSFQFLETKQFASLVYPCWLLHFLHNTQNPRTNTQATHESRGEINLIRSSYSKERPNYEYNSNTGYGLPYLVVLPVHFVFAAGDNKYS
jgi:hypothetical protein